MARLLLSLSDADATLSVFARAVAMYQSNHYGSFPKQQLLDAYSALPSDFKQLLSCSARGLYRGSDQYNSQYNFIDFCADKTEVALSFTRNSGLASMFGSAAAFKSICTSFDFAVDTAKIVRLLNRRRISHNVGDDEGEVILFGVKYRHRMLE